MDEDENENKIAKGFDRDVDYNKIKRKFVKDFNTYYNKLQSEDIDQWKSTRKLLIRKLVYLVIAMIQLRNGSRITEACEAIKLFLKKGIDDKVVVKIAKSESIKYVHSGSKRGGSKNFSGSKKGGNRKKIITKPRYRKMMFPKWFNNEIIELFQSDDEAKETIQNARLKRRVLDFLLRGYDCNTHSLRYAFINYMLYERKEDMNIVAKFVGHVNINMLVRYTQLKNTDKIFDLDI